MRIFATGATPSLPALCDMAREHIIAAREWYSEAEQDIAVICRMENWNTKHFTAILAVTSPRCAVRRNVRITLEYVGNKRFLANTMRAVQRSVEIWETTRIIRGPKTSAFFRALRGDVNAVVLDTHMAKLFAVDPHKAFRRKPELAHWTRVVRRVAELIGETPRDTQAALWYAQRYRIGEYPELFPIAAEYKNWLAHGRQFPDNGAIDYLVEAGERPIDDTF